jgi:Cu/Ag efflux protein CusF
MIRFPKELLAVLALALVAGLTMPVLAESKDREEQTIKGKVKRVSTDDNLFVLTDNKGQDRTFQVAREARIRLNNKDARLSDLREGEEVTVTYRARANDICTEKGAQNAHTTRGQIRRLDADSQRVVLKDRQGKEQTFEFGPDAKVRLEDREAKLTDLKEGQEVAITFTKEGDRMMVRNICTERDGQTAHTAHGQIKSVVADKNQLVLKDSQGRERRFQIAQDAKVRLNDKEANLAALREGEEVAVTYRMVATNIQNNQ